MTKSLLRRRIVVPLGAAAVALAAAFLTCSHFGVLILRDYYVYRHVNSGSYQIGPDLWWGRIDAGDDVEALVAASDPYCVSRLGRWVELRYAPDGPQTSGIPFVGLYVLAKDGQLARTSFFSCTDGRRFFNTMTPAEETDYRRDFEEYVDRLVERRQADAQPSDGGGRSDAK